MSRDSTYVSFESVDSDVVFSQAPSACSSSKYRSNKGKNLLDSEDPFLEVAVSSKYPMTFDLVSANNNSAEFTRSFQHGLFNAENEQNSADKYNLGATETRRSSLSSIVTDTSPYHSYLSGISTNENSQHPTSEKRQQTPSYDTPNQHDLISLRRKASLKENSLVSTSTTSLAKPCRSSSMPKQGRPLHFVNIKTNKSSVHREKSLLNAMSDGLNRTGRTKQVKRNKEESTKKPARSASARKLFSRLRKYRPRSSSREKSSRPSSDVEDSNSICEDTELSSNTSLPGILKIFGDALSPGTNYKSLIATAESTASELVKAALERYSIPFHKASDFELCEVVGKFWNEKEMNKSDCDKGLKMNPKRSHDFTEDYVRPLNDQEKPLILQSLWKPQPGLSRRFEIRHRLKISNPTLQDDDTHQVNMPAESINLQKSRTKNLMKFDATGVESESDDDKVTSFNESSFLNSTDNLNFDVTKRSTQEAHDDQDLCATHSVERVTPVGNAVCVNQECVKPQFSVAGLSCPYLITLQGNEENLIHHLDKAEVLIGSNVTDFKLDASDVLPHHCVIKKRMEILLEEKENCEPTQRWCVTIKPLSSMAEVRINREKISSKHALQHGDLISVGKRHLFLYKDPLSHINLMNLSFINLKQDSDNCSTEAHGSNTSLNTLDLFDSKTPRLESRIVTKLNYRTENEIEILEKIFSCTNNFGSVSPDYSLVPATLLSQCIEHACLNFTLQQTNDLLLKIASTLQSILLDATKKVSVNEIQSTESGNFEFNEVLQLVLFWMSNSLEVFEFLQSSLQPLITDRVVEEKRRGFVDPEFLFSIDEFTVNEEILGLLEEVVMYGFQQLVYYLTKVLYGCLPAIFECNPFLDDPGHTPNVNQITDVFSKTREMTSKFDVNDCIAEQLFGYLFFFCNVSLFNTLMEKGSFVYYKWEMGVRIKANLEVLESWAEKHGCFDLCMKYLDKLSSLANLLAMPRRQLLKTSWTSFRNDFPALSEAQLHKVLTEYQFSSNQPKPSSWMPSSDDMKAALNKNAVQENYDNHPPLVIPPNCCNINLQSVIGDQRFEDLLKSLRSAGANFFDGNVACTQREQPDGGELLKSELSKKDDTYCKLFQKNCSIVEKNKLLNSANELEDEFIQNNANGKVEQERETRNSSSARFSHSIPEAHLPVSSMKVPSITVAEDKEQQSLIIPNSDPVDEFLVLPISTIHSLPTKLSPNKGSLQPPFVRKDNILQQRNNSMPEEVFVVDIKMGPSGLGVGLVDGLVQSIGEKGIYVGSLFPDDPMLTQQSTKDHDVIRCWLQEGKLQLGDRILAVNGINLINTTYTEALTIIKDAGSKVRLLVGRCKKVALKMT